MATLWVAQDADGHEVVIKRLLPEMAADPDQREAFLDEARLATHLDHPNIGHVIELGQVDNAYFIALEFIDGISLEQILAEGALHPELAARVVIEILTALDHAHHATCDGEPLGIVHRDVNPSNVLVSTAGEIKLVDFGVARALTSARRTQSGAVKGKYAYMSPEQIEGQEVTAQSDVFSCGVTLFEVLTGVRPFGDDIRAVSAILRQPTPNLPDLIPAPIAVVCTKALEKSLSERYRSAGEMRDALSNALGSLNSEVGARELSLLVRTLRGLDVSPEESQDIDPELYSTHRGKIQSVATNDEPPRPVVVSTNQRRWWAAASVSGLLFLGLIAFWMMSRPLPQPQTFTLGTATIVPDGTHPEMLAAQEGSHVLIRTFPAAEVHHAGKLIGKTPVSTKLSAGKYRLEFRHDDLRKQATLNVPQDTHLVWEQELEDLDDAETKKPKKAKSKPKAKRSLLDRIKRAIQ